jgi:hypothetical protein
MADIGISALYFIATTAAAAVSADNYYPETGQPAWFGQSAMVEKLYQRGGKVVGTPLLDVAQADERCPNGYVVRGEDRVERDGETWLVWRLTCQKRR